MHGDRRAALAHDNAAAVVNHASTRATQLRGRWRDNVSLDEVEGIRV